MKKLWMAVTADKYELPLAVEPSQTLLARRIGVTMGKRLPENHTNTSTGLLNAIQRLAGSPGIG